jgi:hypothetical protein
MTRDERDTFHTQIVLVDCSDPRPPVSAPAELKQRVERARAARIGTEFLSQPSGPALYVTDPMARRRYDMSPPSSRGRTVRGASPGGAARLESCEPAPMSSRNLFVIG